MQCNTNDTNYRCSDFASYFSNGKDMCESFFPEQLMGKNLITAVRPGEPCITPGEPDESAAIAILDEKSYSEVEYRNRFKNHLTQAGNYEQKCYLIKAFYCPAFLNDSKEIFFLLVIAANGGSGGIYF